MSNNWNLRKPVTLIHGNLLDVAELSVQANNINVSFNVSKIDKLSSCFVDFLPSMLLSNPSLSLKLYLIYFRYLYLL